MKIKEQVYLGKQNYSIRTGDMYQINLIGYEIDPHRADPSQPTLGTIVFFSRKNLWILLEKTKIFIDYGGERSMAINKLPPLIESQK